MSLCQSLRQYVFVHRTVIEGALQLVDEERGTFGEAWMDVDSESGASNGQSPVLALKQSFRARARSE